jgi:hypothetical protein
MSSFQMVSPCYTSGFAVDGGISSDTNVEYSTTDGTGVYIPPVPEQQNCTGEVVLSAAEARNVVIMRREDHEEQARRSTYVTVLLSLVAAVLALLALASYLKYRHIYQDYTQLLQEHQGQQHSSYADGNEAGGGHDIEDEAPDRRLRTSVPAAAWEFDQQPPTMPREQSRTEQPNPLGQPSEVVKDVQSGSPEDTATVTRPDAVEIEMMALRVGDSAE